MSTPKTEAEIINNFAKNINCLNPIYEELSDINFFEILKIDQLEIRHSNFLAWVIDPAAPSGVGDKMLKKLLLFCIDNNDKNPNNKKPLDAIDIDLMDLDDVVVKREHPVTENKRGKKRIDLLISSEKCNFCVCVENKINSKEQKEQLSIYHEYVEEQYARRSTKYTKYKYDNRYYVLLSPNGIEAEKDTDRENWIALSYSDIYDWMEELLQTYSEKIPLKAKAFITDYLNALQRHVIEGDFKKTCQEVYKDHKKAFAIFKRYKGISEASDISNGFKLYEKHREAIDLVLDNRIELTEIIKRRLIDALSHSGYFVKYEPKRAPAYLKVPADITDDKRLVDRTCDDISKDFLFYELYYYPGKQVYSVNLKCQMEYYPAGFDSAAYGKELSKRVLISSTTISKINKKKVSDYIADYETNSTEPAEDDVFIQDLSKEVIKAMHSAKQKTACENIIKAIK